jgi:Rps23 Pro-64 3,4-dihydroxylase Tpa1-like proline 4-hydroxylase
MDHKINVTFVHEGIDVAVFDNFYSEEQLEIALNECVSLIPLLLTPDNTASAVGNNKQLLKRNHGAFIEEKSSSVVEIDYKIIKDKSILSSIIQYNSLYRMLTSMNKTSTLLSYYTDGDYYETHTDAAMFTMIVWIYKEPKIFSGGELILYGPDNKEIKIECLNNRVVLFPSCTPHSVSKVTMPDIHDAGRFCVTHFFNFIDEKL